MLRTTSRAVRVGARSGSAKSAHRAVDEKGREKRPISLNVVWKEAREVVWDKRLRLFAGLGLMLISRAAGMVLPASSKPLIDEVITNRRVVEYLAEYRYVRGHLFGVTAEVDDGRYP